MAEMVNEQELMERWGISEAALQRLIEEGRLTVHEEGGERKFSADEITAFEESKGGEDYLSAEEAVQQLGIPEEELEEAVQEGAATEYRFGAEARYARERLNALAREAGDEPLEEPAEEEAAEPQAEQPAAEEEEGALLDLDQGGGGGLDDDELFDFTDELETEPDATAAGQGEAAEKEALGIEDEETVASMGSEEDLSEGDMITEVVDVSGLEAGEEDILGDIIEDVGADIETEPESTGGLVGEETVDMPTSQDATSEITELEEDTLESEFEEGERTADITQLEEEAFEGEELEDILAGEEELHGELDEEEFEVPYGAPVATEAEAPVAAWVLVLLLLVLIVQVVAALFVVENSISPRYSTGITKYINFFQESGD